MTDIELAAAIRKAAADYDRALDRVEADLWGLLQAFQTLVKEAEGHNAIAAIGNYRRISDLEVRPRERIGDVSVHRYVEL